MADFYRPDAPLARFVEDSSAECAEELDEASFLRREDGLKLVLERSSVLYSNMARFEFKDVILKPWRAMGELAREELILGTLAEMHGGNRDDAFGLLGDDRTLVLEINLAGLAGNNGEGFVTLINVLLPSSEQPTAYSAVRHADFERVHGFILDGESLVPRSKGVRARQEQTLICRHNRLHIFVATVFDLMVRSVSLEMSQSLLILCRSGKSTPHTPASLFLRTARPATPLCTRHNWPRPLLGGLKA